MSIDLKYDVLGDSRPEKAVLLKKNISLVIYIFRGHIRAHMKGNEMLFEIIGKKIWFVGVASVLYR